jgi:hypothetical protein
VSTWTFTHLDAVKKEVVKKTLTMFGIEFEILPSLKFSEIQEFKAGMQNFGNEGMEILIYMLQVFSRTRTAKGTPEFPYSFEDLDGKLTPEEIADLSKNIRILMCELPADEGIDTGKLVTTKKSKKS